MMGRQSGSGSGLFYRYYFGNRLEVLRKTNFSGKLVVVL
jgi:hypothetical protein